MNKKILIISPRFYPSIWWIEEQVKVLWENFTKKWYEVDILTKRYNKNLLTQENIFWLNIFRFKGNFSFFLFFLRKKKYELIISRQYYKNSFLLWILKFFKILKLKTIIVWDWWTSYNEIEIIKQKLRFLGLYKIYFFFISRNDYLVWNNDDFINSLIKYFKKNKIKKIYNWLKIVKSQNKKPSEIKNILFLSRFEKEKWIFETIEAFKNIKQDEIRLNIVWYWEKEIEDKIKNICKNDKKIFFLWKLYFQEKEKILKKTDLFLFPSYYPWESFWIILYEVAIKNIPIISTDFWDTKKIFENNIIYVKKMDSNNLKEKIEWAIKNIWNFKYDYSEVFSKVDINKTTDDLLKI